MSNVLKIDFSGQVYSFTDAGWFNATEAAKRFDKEPFDWLRQRETVSYICALAKRQTNSDFLTELNKIKDLDGSSSASRSRLFNLVKKTGLVRTKAGAPETGGAKIEHRAVLQLCKKHIKHLERFGRVAFEMQPFETKGGKQIKRILLLNEGQATFLMTLLKNTEPVVDFKFALVKAFLAAKDLMFNEYRGLAKQHANLCLELKDEKQIASLSGRNLSLWRKKHKVLAQAIADVEQKMQPSLNFDG